MFMAFMKLSNLFNNKWIAVVAAIFGVVYFAPTANIPLGLAWLIGAIFTWMRHKWAAVLLTVLALRNFVFDILFDLPKLKTAILEVPPDSKLSESTIFAVGIGAFSLEVLILLWIICFGIIFVLADNSKS